MTTTSVNQSNTAQATQALNAPQSVQHGGLANSQVGTAHNAPSKLEVAGAAVKNFFSSIGSMIHSTADKIVSALASLYSSKADASDLPPIPSFEGTAAQFRWIDAPGDPLKRIETEAGKDSRVLQNAQRDVRDNFATALSALEADPTGGMDDFLGSNSGITKGLTTLGGDTAAFRDLTMHQIAKHRDALASAVNDPDNKLNNGAYDLSQLDKQDFDGLLKAAKGIVSSALNPVSSGVNSGPIQGLISIRQVLSNEYMDEMAHLGGQINDSNLPPDVKTEANLALAKDLLHGRLGPALSENVNNLTGSAGATIQLIGELISSGADGADFNSEFPGVSDPAVKADFDDFARSLDASVKMFAYATMNIDTL
ncbi:hypothetical protein ACG74X_16485 [Marivita sp. S0852]|uniref:hypothetical protein n=1 Tax=Marivita sp. S0852 TaxID=3373893 RepID=UPI0039824CE8